MFKLNVIWRGYKPQYKGIGDDVENISHGGVKTFEGDDWSEIYTAVGEWAGDCSVSFGEECGSFKIDGAFEGEYSDLVAGKSRLKSTEELWREAKYWEEHNKGVCSRCREYYEGDAPIETLYRHGEQWFCGDCMNEIQGEKMEREYMGQGAE
jgi:hypothetical protein